MMLRIYLSSTYEDLVEYRDAVYAILRKVGHDVIAMDDYVATDLRPVDKCLADLATCHVYIGLIAWRFGYVPPRENVENRSITEMEFRRAGELNVPRLMFLAHKGAHFPDAFRDAVTGQNEAGQRIANLRDEVEQNFVVSHFKAPDHLASEVLAALLRQLETGSDIKNEAVPGAARSPDARLAQTSDAGPYWEWNSLEPVSLARFVNKDATRWLPSLAAASKAPSPRTAASRIRLVELIYEALAAEQIRFVCERPRAGTPIGRVRPPGTILRPPRLGSCLELALLFCGVCESLGLLPFLVVTVDMNHGTHHAFAVVERDFGADDWDAKARRWPSFARSPLIDNRDWLAGRIPGACVAVECTGFAAVLAGQLQLSVPEGPGRETNGHLSFAAASEAGTRQFAYSGREFRFALDISSARMLWRLPSHPIDLPSPPMRDTGILPLLSNRDTQVDMITSAVNLTGCRPQLFIIPGNIMERHDVLIERLARFDLPKCLSYKNDTQFIPPSWDLPLPSPDTSSTSWLRKTVGAQTVSPTHDDSWLRLALGMKLQLPTYPEPPEWNAIARKLKDHPGRYLFAHFLDERTWRLNRGSRIEQIVAAWASCPDLDRASRPIVLLCVVFGGTRADSIFDHLKGWLGLAGKPMRILERYMASRLVMGERQAIGRPGASGAPQFLSSASPRGVGVEMHVVDELRCVEKVKAAFWCSIQHVREFCQGANLTGEVLGYYDSKRTDCLTMNELIKALHPILENHGSRVS
jgi:hypothetical protein